MTPDQYNEIVGCLKVYQAYIDDRRSTPEQIAERISLRVFHDHDHIAEVLAVHARWIEDHASSTTTTASPATDPQMGAATGVDAPATLKAEMPLKSAAPKLEQPKTEPTPKLEQHLRAEAARKTSLAEKYSRVPGEMKQLRAWVTWSGTKDKQPYISGGGQRPVHTDNPNDMVSFDILIANFESGIGYQHAGFMPTKTPDGKRIIGMDLDSCRDPLTGKVLEWAIKFLELLPRTYTEVTPSGGGLRPWVKVPLEHKEVVSIKPELASVATKAPQIEPLVKNYGTITGQVYGDAPSTIAEVSSERWAEILREMAPYLDSDPNRTTADADDKKFTDINLAGEKIPNGKHDTTLFKVGCALRNKGFDQPEIESYLVQFCENRCEAYGSDYVDMCEKKAKQACKYPKGSAPGAYDVMVGSAAQPFTSTPNLEVREVEEPEESSSPLVLPHSVLTSSVLGDLYDQVFAPNGWTMELALPSLATACSVLVPRKESRGTVLVEPPLTQLYTGLIGPVNVGKSQIIEWSAKAVGIFADERNEHYVQVKFGSAEQMWKYLHMFSKGVSSASNAFHTAVLINPDEWSHVMAKAGIPDASFASNLTTAFNKLRHIVTLGGQGGGRPVEIPFPFSIIGGIVDTEFGNTYSANTVGGLYDRMLFGVAPEGFDWAYRPFPYHHPFLCGIGKVGLVPVPVDIQPDVWELTKAWKKQDKGLTRIIEIAVRVATIFASMDGRAILPAKEVEKLWGFLTYEKNVRGLFLPNPGVNPDAVYANAALAWIELHAKQWRTFKELKDGTNYYRRQLGPYVCTRTLQMLTKDNEIDMWVSGLNKEGKLNPMPADYQGKRPAIGEGLVRVAAP